MKSYRRFTPEEDAKILEFYRVYDQYQDSHFNLTGFSVTLNRHIQSIINRAIILGVYGKARHNLGNQGKKTLEQRYSVNEDTGCWEQNIRRGVSTDGDLKLSIDGRRGQSRRLLWENKNGRISGKQIIRVNCLNPKCINPDHMELLTPYESNQRNKTTKITPDKIKEMFTLRDQGWSTRSLAKTMKCDHSLIARILRGERHLGALDPSRRVQA